MRLVLVEWLDSYGCSSDWQAIESCNPKLLSCRSVGWLAYDGDDCKVIIPHISEPLPEATSQGCGDMTIPSKAVVRMVDLQEPARERASRL